MESVHQSGNSFNNGIEQKTRIEWVDVFKAVCIIFMVLGHTWGGANSYIYQFHIAAFFFISGFTSNIWKHDLESLTLKKIHTLMIPLIVMIIILSPIAHLIGDGMNLIDSLIMLKDDFHALIYWDGVVNLLGAAWFIISLFWIFIIHRVMYAFSNKFGGIWVYLALTIVLFILGYHLSSSGFRSVRQEDITLVAQLYFGIGVFVRQKIFKSRDLSTKTLLIAFIVSAVILIIAGKISVPTVMDFPSRVYPSIIVMVTIPFIGCIMVYSFSILVCRYGAKIKEFLLIIGRETLGILFLHFFAFKFATVLLIILGKASFSDLKLFLPVTIVGDNPILITLYVVTAVCISVIIWKTLCGIPYLRWALGKQEVKQ